MSPELQEERDWLILPLGCCGFGWERLEPDSELSEAPAPQRRSSPHHRGQSWCARPACSLPRAGSSETVSAPERTEPAEGERSGGTRLCRLPCFFRPRTLEKEKRGFCSCRTHEAKEGTLGRGSGDTHAPGTNPTSSPRPKAHPAPPGCGPPSQAQTC